jgi:hypothetical protein
MTAPDCRAVLETAVAEPARLDADARRALATAPDATLDAALRDVATAHGAAALPLLTMLAEDAHRGLRRAARRALYRLAQRGVSAPARPARRPVVERRPELPARAWMSGIDGTGSRAIWVLFEGGFGGGALCSLIVNDTAGILDVAGGEITRKRLETELASLRASQKLPWVEVPPPRAVRAVMEALALHPALGTSAPATFERWRVGFEEAARTAPAEGATASGPAGEHDAHALAESAELLTLPELASWFIDPAAVQSDSLALLEARQSRLVVSDQIKAEREQAIVAKIVERELGHDARRRWARRLDEMAYVFDATDRAPTAGIARAAAAALVDDTRPIVSQPFAVALARRALEIAGEVAAGRLSAADVSRTP